VILPIIVQQKKLNNDNHTVLTIEHNARTTTTNNHQDKSSIAATAAVAKLCFGMSKPVFMIVSGLILVMTALAGLGLFFDGSWSRMLGLDAQVDVLKSEISRLENQVAEFEVTTEKLTSEVTRLNTAVTSLSSEINELNTITDDINTTTNELQTLLEDDFTSNNALLSKLLQELLQGNMALENSVGTLKNTTSDFVAITSELEDLNVQLENSVSNSKEVQENLAATNTELKRQISSLNLNVQLLEELNLQSETSNDLLTKQNEVFQGQNLLLEVRINDVETLIMKYFDEDGDTVGDDVIEELLKLMEGNRELVVKNLELGYEQTRDTWLCDYRSTYSGDNFTTTGKNDPINDESLWEEIYSNSIQAKALRPLCLYNTTNYEIFVRNEIVVDGDDNTLLLYQLLSSNTIRQSIARYTSRAIYYYFSSGLVSSQDWADAEYDCTKLPTNLQFMYGYEKDDDILQ